MGVVWWGHEEHVSLPHTHTHLAVVGTGYLIPSSFGDGTKSRISIFISVLRSFLLDLFGPHVLAPYYDILSVYSIHRMMRGNINQTVNTVKREIFAAIKFCSFDHKAILLRFNFAVFPCCKLNIYGTKYLWTI